MLIPIRSDQISEPLRFRSQLEYLIIIATARIHSGSVFSNRHSRGLESDDVAEVGPPRREHLGLGHH